MASSHRSVRNLTAGSLMFGLLMGVGLVAPLPAPAAGKALKGCSALERRLAPRLRHGLKKCAKLDGQVGPLSCASRKRAQHVGTLLGRGCAKPPWAVVVETVAVDRDTVALRWTSRLNWARLLDRQEDPIASTVRGPGGLLTNLLLLDGRGDIATVVDYVEDVEARAVDVVNGLPADLRGATRGRGSFPRIRDDSAAKAADTFVEIIQACNEGAPSMFAERQLGGTSGSRGGSDFGAGDGGGRGLALAYVVADIFNAIFEDDEDEAADPPADDEQCADTDGSCNAGEENEETEQSEEGSDDEEGSPAPAPSGTPASDPGSGEETSCARDTASFMAFCDDAAWGTPACRAFVRHANGCADERLVDPGPEGDVPCTGAGMSEAEYRQLDCEARQGVMQPGPDGELVCRSIDPGQPRPDLGIDPCNGPETQGTAETCGEQGGVGESQVGEVPPAPRPDPRGSLR